MTHKHFKTKRIYEVPADDESYRVLVDRLWPRGISKEDAQLDEWLKKVAPSSELRKWFDHDPGKFEEFRNRYKVELIDREEPVNKLLEIAGDQPVTLLYAAKDKTHNHAVVLRQFLENRI